MTKNILVAVLIRTYFIWYVRSDKLQELLWFIYFNRWRKRTSTDFYSSYSQFNNRLLWKDTLDNNATRLQTDDEIKWINTAKKMR